MREGISEEGDKIASVRLCFPPFGLEVIASLAKAQARAIDKSMAVSETGGNDL